MTIVTRSTKAVFLKVIFLAAVVFATACPPASALGVGDSLGFSPFWDYKTIETEHFRITFPVELTDTAQKTANYLEEANTELAPALYWQPHYKASIVLIDNVDSENGATTPLLRFGIVLFVTPPDNWTSTAYYDNWLRLLCFHEYTHFLNMDATRGAWAGLRYVFGDVLLPTTTWPTWMLEGLAVYDETRYSQAGRGRSPYYDMILRTSVLENVLDTRKFITLDKVNGPNPWYPGGETSYLFGYSLMNQVAHYAKAGPTHDGKYNLRSGEDALGVMSLRSSWRFPFFINGNLENITGEDWYQSWNAFIGSTRAHANEQLKTIRSAKVASFTRLTHDSYNIYGPRLSPDGKWIAYTQDGLNDISGLYLRNRKTGATVRLEDKNGGVTVAFSSDSLFLFLSRTHRIRDYYLYSDIEVMNLVDGSTHWVTSRLRARDPSVSFDHRSIAFTATRNSTTLLMQGDLKFENGQFALGPTRILYSGKKFDRVATPQFSPDGNQIAFTLHRNGDVGENLMIVDLKRNKVYTAIQDKALNRYPTWDDSGRLYFVSDRTGVDNLYRYRFDQNERGAADLVSNYETGVAFPFFSKQLAPDHYLATVFSTGGWDLAEATLPTQSYNPETLTVTPPNAPPVDEKSLDHAQTNTYPVEDYSIFPTIWPRGWAPTLAISNLGAYVGGAVIGYDQVDRHRYALVGAYDTFVKKGDIYGTYENRLLGVTLGGVVDTYTSSETTSGNSLLGYGRTVNYSLYAYYTFVNTYSTLTPELYYNLQRETDYAVSPTGGPDVQIGQTALVPDAQATLTYSDAESSRLAVVPERGRTTVGGARVYMNSGNNTWKGLLADYENIELGTSHVVFAPSVKGSWVSHTGFYNPANVLVQGRYSNQLINTFATDSFDHLGIHGYPLQAFYTRAAGVAYGSLSFPISRLFWGPGTAPIFAQNFYGFGFGEATYFPARDINPVVLPAAGGGLKLDIDIAQYIPIELRLEYDKGFRPQVGGTGEIFFEAGLQSALPF